MAALTTLELAHAVNLATGQYALADAGGDSFTNDGRTILRFMNSHTVDHVVTFTRNRESDFGSQRDVVLSVEEQGGAPEVHDGFIDIGPFPIKQWGGTVSWTYGATPTLLFLRPFHREAIRGLGDDYDTAESVATPVMGVAPGEVTIVNFVGGDPYGNFEAFDADGMGMVNDGETSVWLDNPGGVSSTVFFLSQGTDDHGFTDQHLHIPLAAGINQMPALPRARFGGLVQMQVTDNTNITVVALRLNKFKG